MEKPFDYVFIDTSVFIKQSYFKRTESVYRLFELAGEGWIRILMPEIAKREWIKHYNVATKLKFAEVERKTIIMGKTKEANGFLTEHEKLANTYDTIVLDAFNEHMNRANVIEIPTSYVCDKLESVVNRYFAKEKPFGDKGKEKEFPDAFILASLEKYAAENSIKQIQIFSTDGDMCEYNNTLFINRDPSAYLNEFLSKRIPEHEEEIEKRERDKKDITRLFDYIKNNSTDLEPNIRKYVEKYLDDVSRYSEHFNYVDINEVSIKTLNLISNVKDIEILTVESECLQAIYYVNLDTKININHFSEENSVWDPEEKGYIFENYIDSDVEITSTIKVTIEMDRTASEINQKPKIDIIEIDTDDLQDAIDGDYPHGTYKATRKLGNIAMSPTIQSAIKQALEMPKINTPITAAISSLSTLQSAVDSLKEPLVAQGIQQMSLINPSIKEMVSAAQEVNNSITASALIPSTELNIQEVLKQKEKTAAISSFSALQSVADSLKEPLVAQEIQQRSLINPSIKEMITAAQKVNNSITASALIPSTELNIQEVLKQKEKTAAISS
ncbi:PIN domain-containing protein, partial [Prevotella sp.]